MDLKITALIIWIIITAIIIGIPFIRANRDERLILVLVGLLSILLFMKNLQN